MSDRVTPCECRVYLSRRGLLHDEYAASASVIKCDRCKASVNAHDRLTRENAKMRRALQAVLSNPVVDGFSARIRDHAKQNGLTNPLEQAEAALAAEGEE